MFDRLEVRQAIYRHLTEFGHAVASATNVYLHVGHDLGSIDNLLRPRLVGRDTQMHDLLILFGTMGGILLFGVLGFIVGPIVAALFVTVWDMYGLAFKELLPAVGPLSGGGPAEPDLAETSGPPAQERVDRGSADSFDPQI